MMCTREDWRKLWAVDSFILSRNRTALHTTHTDQHTTNLSLSLCSYNTHTHTFHLPLSWELWCVCVCAWMIYSMPSTTAGCLMGWHVHLSQGAYSCVSVREVTTRLSYLSECWYSKRRIFSSIPHPFPLLPLPEKTNWRGPLPASPLNFPHSLEKIPLLFPLWCSDNHSTDICLPPSLFTPGILNHPRIFSYFF